jgi:GTP-binding protein
MMCSRASELPESYKRYLVNGLREAFDLPGVPIRLIVKSGKNPYAEGDRGGSGSEAKKSAPRPVPRKTGPKKPSAGKAVSSKPARMKPSGRG